MRVLVAGGAGFIGNNFVRYLLSRYPDREVTILDKLTYAARKENIRDILSNVRFIKGDVCNGEDVSQALSGCKIVYNFAAETHVDRSIVEASPFIQTNIQGTQVLLEAARRSGVEQFFQISTDEVYGSVAKGASTESDPLDPSSPYSASKAASELLARSHYKTYQFPVIVIRPSNNFGPFQYPEKLIPVLIINALHNEPLPIYGDGLQVRDWLYVEDACAGIDVIANEGEAGEVYNLGAGNGITNLEIAKRILAIMGKPESLISYVKDRPGHDRRYAMNCARITSLGWKPVVSLEEGLRKTVHWYLENKEFWEPLRQTGVLAVSQQGLYPSQGL